MVALSAAEPPTEQDHAPSGQLITLAQHLNVYVRHIELARIDPVAAARIHPNDPQRIQRALEVFELTGQQISDFHDSGRRSGFPYAAIKMVLAPADRERMHSRIEARFRQMLEAGFIDEVRALCQRGDLDAGLPAMRAVGYRQVQAYLDEQIDYEEMVRRAVIATRQYAKRQLTWLRSERDATWFDAENPDASSEMRRFLQERFKQCKISM